MKIKNLVNFMKNLLSLNYKELMKSFIKDFNNPVSCADRTISINLKSSTCSKPEGFSSSLLRKLKTLLSKYKSIISLILSISELKVSGFKIPY